MTNQNDATSDGDEFADFNADGVPQQSTSSASSEPDMTEEEKDEFAGLESDVKPKPAKPAPKPAPKAEPSVVVQPELIAEAEAKALAKLEAETETRMRAKAEANAKAEAKLQAEADAEAKLKAEAREKALAEARVALEKEAAKEAAMAAEVASRVASALDAHGPTMSSPPAPPKSMTGPKLPTLLVGSNPDNDCVVKENPSVEAYHAILTLMEDGAICVNDYSSKTGTFINDVKVPVTGMGAEVGQVLKFGTAAFTLAKSKEGVLYLAPVTNQPVTEESKMPTTDKPTGHTANFIAEGEIISESNRAEQAKLDAAAAAAPPPTPKRTSTTNRMPRMSTGQLKAQARGSKIPKVLVVGAGCAIFVALMVASALWTADKLGYGYGSPRDVLATTTPPTHAPTMVRPTPTVVRPVPTPITTTTQPVQPVMTVAPTVTEPTEPIVTAPPTTTGYSCRAGSEVASCHHVTDFLLAKADGAPYWDCSSISGEQYRNLYTIEDGAGARHVVANTCACQLCEPTAL